MSCDVPTALVYGFRPKQLRKFAQLRPPGIIVIDPAVYGIPGRHGQLPGSVTVEASRSMPNFQYRVVTFSMALTARVLGGAWDSNSAFIWVRVSCKGRIRSLLWVNRIYDSQRDCV